MTLNEIHEYLAGRTSIEKVPLNWDSTGYTSEAFNHWAGSPDFSGWMGDLPTEDEVRVIVKLLKVQPGDSLLDVACGYGRHALLLATQYALKVTGIDVSPGLITTAKRLAAEQHIDINYEVRHAKDLPWNNDFNQTLIGYNSFSLFSPEDAPVILKGIHRGLRSSGRLFLDLDNKPFNCQYGIIDTSWDILSGNLKLQEIFFHEDISVEVCRDLYFKEDTDQVEEFIIFKRLYSKSEICELLSKCGFRVTKIYGGWDLSSLKENSAKMLFGGVKE